jgi:hypothetical protein
MVHCLSISLALLSVGVRYIAGLDRLLTNWVDAVYTLGIGLAILVTALVFSAAVLKVACGLVRANVPDTGLAMVVTILEAVTGGLARFIAVTGVGYLGRQALLGHDDATAVTAFTVVTLAVFVPAAVYMPMLRVSFGKAVLIALLRYALTFAVAFTVAYLYVAITGTSRPPQIFF